MMIEWRRTGRWPNDIWVGEDENGSVRGVAVWVSAGHLGGWQVVGAHGQLLAQCEKQWSDVIEMVESQKSVTGKISA